MSTITVPVRTAKQHGSAGSDQHGNPISGTTENIAGTDVAVDSLLRYHVDLVDQMTSLAEDEPGFAMGEILARTCR